MIEISHFDYFSTCDICGFPEFCRLIEDKEKNFRAAICFNCLLGKVVTDSSDLIEDEDFAEALNQIEKNTRDDIEFDISEVLKEILAPKQWLLCQKIIDSKKSVKWEQLFKLLNRIWKPRKQQQQKDPSAVCEYYI
jgi:hypothetical protein